MIRFRMDADRPDPGAIEAAADAIRRGELVVFPTETVYGLAADALNENAVRRVFEAKGRGERHPLPVQVAGSANLSQVAAEVPVGAAALAERFWPGPLTIVLPKGSEVSDAVSGGAATIGVRVPDHPVALALLRKLGLPIVATSANLTGQPPPTTADGAVRQLGESVSVVLDAGECRIGVASTVVDLSVSPPRILRAGAVSAEEIRDILGELHDSGS